VCCEISDLLLVSYDVHLIDIQVKLEMETRLSRKRLNPHCRDDLRVKPRLDIEAN
jgi:hypothetical protein